MASISNYLAKILEAKFGEEVRNSIYDAIEAINIESTSTFNKVNNMSATAVKLPGGQNPTVTITDNGSQKNIKFGIPAGESGYTPVRGKDYWTADDQKAVTAASEAATAASEAATAASEAATAASEAAENVDSKVENAVAPMKEDVSQLSESITDTTGCKILPYIKGKYINTSTNPIDPNPSKRDGFRYSLFECVEGDKFTINGQGGGIANLCTFLDSDYRIISVPFGNTEVYDNSVVVAPNGAAYILINDKANKLCYKGVPLLKVIDDEVKSFAGEWDTGKYINEKVDIHNINGITTFENNLIIYDECLNNAYISWTNGAIANSEMYFCTGFIPVIGDTSYKVNAGRNGAWYDANKNYISGFSGEFKTQIAPSSAKYLRFTVNKNKDGISIPFELYLAKESEYKDTNKVVIPNLVVENNLPWCYGKKINWIGDSIVDGRDFDEVVCENIGLVKENEYGINGSTIGLKSDGTDGRNALCLRYASMTDDADIVAVSCGTNDYQYAWNTLGTIESTENTTFYGALKTLCEGLINKYPQKLIFFTTPIKRAQPYDTDAETGEGTNTVKTNPWSRNANGNTLKDYRDAIIEVCGYYSIPVLDMWGESLLNPHMASQADMFDSIGTHPNSVGREIMARRVCGWLTQIGYTIK